MPCEPVFRGPLLDLALAASSALALASVGDRALGSEPTCLHGTERSRILGDGMSLRLSTHQPSVSHGKPCPPHLAPLALSWVPLGALPFRLQTHVGSVAGDGAGQNEGLVGRTCSVDTSHDEDM